MKRIPENMKQRGTVLGMVVGASLLAVLGLAGCSSESSGSQSSSAVQSAAPTSAAPVTLPKTPLGSSSQWVIDQLNAPEKLTAAAWEKRLSKKITDQMSAQALVDYLNSDIRPSAPFTPVDFQADGVTATTVLQQKNGTQLVLVLTVGTGETFTGIYFRPAAG